MENWIFPNGQNLTPKGVNNSSIEIFLDSIADSLTREVIQNSLDAHNPDVEAPVEVFFEFFDMPTSQIPEANYIKSDVLPKAIDFWTNKNNKDTLKYLNTFKETIYSETIKVLKISDYNTKGLNKKNYESLVVGDGYSEKDNEDSAGSKGIGKAAPFAASNLRMVFYNTLSTENLTKSVGILNFVSYLKRQEGNYITQERSSYLPEGKDYIDKQLTFNTKERVNGEFGTDIFIIGLKPFENWHEQVIVSTINNFLVSIIDNSLEVQVGNIVIDKDSLSFLMKDILDNYTLNSEQKAAFNKTRRFYDVLTNEDRLEFELDDRFERYSFVESLSDAKLLLLAHEPANRTVLQTRKAGMKIYERNRISGNINFSGVFQATGNKLNSFLKDLENANHNIWSTDRKQGRERTEADNFLRDLLRWYKQKVNESFASEGEGNIDAFGVSDLLPLSRNDDKEREKAKDKGIKNIIDKVQINKRNTKMKFYDGDKEEDLMNKSLEAVGLGEGESSGGGSSRKGSGDGDSPDVQGGIGEEEGDKGFDDQGDQVVTEIEKRVSAPDSLNIKIVEVNYIQGQYKVIGKVFKGIRHAEIDLRSVGANGISYKIRVLEANSNTHNVEIKRNMIRMKNARKNNNFIIDIHIDSKLRMKMEGVVYEIKS